MANVIGACKILHVDDVAGLFTSPKGEEWLKTGTIETNVSGYPNAKNSLPVDAQIGGVYTGKSFYCGTQDITPVGMCWNGTHYFVIGTNTDKVYRYTEAGVYDNFSFSCGTTAPAAIIWDGDYFWILNTTGTLIRFNADGTNPFDNFSTGVASANGVCWDGKNFWIVERATDTIFEIDSNTRVATGVSFSVVNEDDWSSGVLFDGLHFYMVGNSNIVYRYTKDGVYTGENFSVTTQDTAVTGIAWDGTSIWIVGNNNDTMYEYTGFEPYTVGDYTGYSFELTNGGTDVRGVAYTGTEYVSVDASTGVSYVYDFEGTYLRGYGLTVTATNNWDCTFDGTYLWVVIYHSSSWKLEKYYVTQGGSAITSFNIASYGGVCFDGTDLVFSDYLGSVIKYDLAGSISSNPSWNFTTETTQVKAIEFVSGYYYVLDSDGTVYIYASDGVYTGDSFLLNDGAAASGICFDGTHIWAVNNSTDIASAYTGHIPYVGIPTHEYDISTSLPIYTRIK